METLEKYSKIARLLVKQWKGLITNQEREELETWQAADARHRALYRKIMSREFLANKLEQEKEIDHVATWLAIHARHLARKRGRIFRRVSTVAAALLLACGGIYWLTGEREALLPVATIVPGESKAELLLPDGTVLRLDKESRVSELLATSARAVADISPTVPTYNELRTPRGGEYTVTLPDGTSVFLNSESRLRFPAVFDATERRVSFSGEAYFEVARDTTSPFRVELEGSVIEVLGTSFNVRAYTDESDARTTLVKGSVTFSSPTGSVLLRAGEQGIVDRAGRLNKREVDVELYTGWKDGYFAFDRSRLEEVMRDISRWYKVNVLFEDPGLKEISFSGIVKRYGDFNTVIRMLEMTGDTSFTVTGDTITIRKIGKATPPRSGPRPNASE
ncbi:MAG: FecR domain-containing protein [Odoribacteraceae bacterium]|nr:FecR domain-containing protein [Odoribacteraceae bacterium]